MNHMKIIRPEVDHLPSFIAALKQGWSPDTLRGGDADLHELEAIRRDPVLYLARLVDREAQGPPVVLPNGTSVPRLPGYRHWMWDGDFCGAISFRWQPGTTALPPHCLGHIGYSVVPWKQRKGYATEALRQLLPIVKREGLAFVEITTDPANHASRRVIEANGGVFIEEFVKSDEHGGGMGLR
jgi:predicted acetyltransferase